MSKDKEIGAIQWFNSEKGFGVVSTSHKNEDYFLHKSNVTGPISSFSPGAPVYFEKGFEKKRLTALKVRLINKDDLGMVINHAIHNSSVKIQRKVSRKNRYGKIYTKSIEERESLFKVCIQYYIQKYTSDDIIDISVKYLTSLSRKDLIEQEYNIKQLGNLLRPNSDSQSKHIDELSKAINEGRDLPHIEDLRKYVYEEIKNSKNFSLLVILWKYEFLNPLPDEHFMFDEGQKLPFNPEYLIQHDDLIDKKEIKLLKYYRIDDQILVDLFEEKYAKKPLVVDDLEIVHFYITAFPSISAKCFDLISDLFDDRLIFNAWVQKKYAINLKQKEIKEIVFSEDYKIPTPLFLKFFSEIDYSALTRIQKNYENSDDILEKVLLKIFKNRNNLSEEDRYRSVELIREKKTRKKVLEVYASQYFKASFPFLIKSAPINFIEECISYSAESDTIIKDLPEKIVAILSGTECAISNNRKIELLSLFGEETLKNYYRQNIDKLIDRDKLQFLKASKNPEIEKLTLDHWNFDASNLTVSLLTSITLDLEKSQSAFITNFEERVEDYKLYEILRIYSSTNLSFLIPLIVSKLSFHSQNELRDSLDSIENENNPILEKFSRESSSLGIEDFAHSLKVFSDYELKVSPNLINSRISNTSSDELSTVFEISDELHNHYPDAIEFGFLELINKKRNDEIPLLKFIEHSYSTKVIAKLLDLIDIGKESDELIKLIIEKPEFKRINSSTVEPVFRTLCLDNFKEVIKYTSEYHPSIVNGLLEECSINPNNINDILNYIDTNDGVGQNLNISSEFSVIRNFITEPSKDKFIVRLNELFKKSNYSYQLPILKYLVYRYYKKLLQKDELIKILHHIDVVQLSSILFKAFILEKAINREEMMRKMNFLLKTHFKKIIGNNITNETYRHIFSLEGLVKKCNGRKKYGGVDLWTGGRQTRYYTDGDHYIYTEYEENIYCEGRFWKEQKFYFKESNRPTGEACNLFWCRNDLCVGINDEVDLTLDFHKWTLNELNELFDINLDRLVFTHLAGWLNRMETIIEKLKCYECAEILRPINYVPKKLGFYAVPLFHCVNELCEEQNLKVRFTHCRGCQKILDSRECDTCNKCNWLICDNEDCGKCGCGANYTPKEVQYPN